MRKAALFLVALFGAATIVSCGGDDDTDGGDILRRGSSRQRNRNEHAKPT